MTTVHLILHIENGPLEQSRTEKLLLGERKPTSRNNYSGRNSLPALRLGSSEQSIWANCLFKSKLSVYIDSNSHHLTLCLCGSWQKPNSVCFFWVRKSFFSHAPGCFGVGRRLTDFRTKPPSTCASKTLALFKESRSLLFYQLNSCKQSYIPIMAASFVMQSLDLLEEINEFVELLKFMLSPPSWLR